jgi:hypothetical protein
MNTIIGYRRWRGLLVVCLASAVLCGCGRYQMRGVVVEGAISTIRVMDENDPRLLEAYGLPLATIEATLDAERLSRKQLPRGISDVDGTFVVPVDEPGAGYLDYYVRVIVQKAGYDTAVQNLRVPGPKQRLLVTLSRGADRYKPDAPDLMDETLKMGEPYMR